LKVQELMIAISLRKMETPLNGNLLKLRLKRDLAQELLTLQLFTVEICTCSVDKMMITISLTIYGNTILIQEFTRKSFFLQILLFQLPDQDTAQIFSTAKCTFLEVFSN